MFRERLLRDWKRVSHCTRSSTTCYSTRCSSFAGSSLRRGPRWRAPLEAPSSLECRVLYVGEARRPLWVALSSAQPGDQEVRRRRGLPFPQRLDTANRCSGERVHCALRINWLALLETEPSSLLERSHVSGGAMFGSVILSCGDAKKRMPPLPAEPDVMKKKIARRVKFGGPAGAISVRKLRKLQ